MRRRNQLKEVRRVRRFDPWVIVFYVLGALTGVALLRLMHTV